MMKNLQQEHLKGINVQEGFETTVRSKKLSMVMKVRVLLINGTLWGTQDTRSSESTNIEVVEAPKMITGPRVTILLLECDIVCQKKRRQLKEKRFDDL